MKFFLIIMIFGPVSNFEHIEFDSYRACDIARVAVMANSGDLHLKAFCVPAQ